MRMARRSTRGFRRNSGARRTLFLMASDRIRYSQGRGIIGDSRRSSQSFSVKATSAAARRPTSFMGRNRVRIGRIVLTGILSAGTILVPLMARAQEAQKNPRPDPADPSAPSMSIKPYQPITGGQRVRWILSNTVAPSALAVGLLAAGYDTARDEPEEYHGTWSGFGKRYGIRLSQTATSNIMEAGLGSVWGEDPRYFPAYTQPFKGRLRNVVISAVLARDRSGQFRPAYARFIAIPGSTFLSNTWRADSEASTSDALSRTAWAFLGQISRNAFVEFWPDFHRRVLHNKF
jgi:hypothetical protein